MSTNTDSREVSRAFGRRECRTCDGSGKLRQELEGWTFEEPCPECLEREAERDRLDRFQRKTARASLIAALVPLTVAGLALAWVMWRVLSGRWGL